MADLTYETALLEKDQVQGTGDKEKLLKSFTRVRRLKERLPDMEIVASHYLTAKEALARATSLAVEKGENIS